MKEIIAITAVLIAIAAAAAIAGGRLLDHINEKGEAEDEERQFEDARNRIHHPEQLYLHL